MVPHAAQLHAGKAPPTLDLGVPLITHAIADGSAPCRRPRRQRALLLPQKRRAVRVRRTRYAGIPVSRVGLPRGTLVAQTLP
eukprot:2892401-Rhodomonas_salina.1